ncbi:MAG: excisionase family DNA-binding protein [Deltaproteobacteria bacterium]|nr:excisionase family DNA-binding protein [Deltaproteobacteria bacterium]
MEQMYSITQLASRLHVCELTVSRWIKAGKLDYVELSPRRRLIPESAVQKFLDSKFIRPPKKMVDPDARSAKHSQNGSLATREVGEMNVKSFKELKREISQCRYK